MSVEELSKVITETRISLARMGQSLDTLTRNVDKLQKDVEDIKVKIFGMEKSTVSRQECKRRHDKSDDQNKSLLSLRDKIIGAVFIGTAILSMLLSLFKDSILEGLSL